MTVLLRDNEIWLLAVLLFFYIFYFATLFYFIYDEKRNKYKSNGTEPFLQLNLIRNVLAFAALGLPFAAIIKNQIEKTAFESDSYLLLFNGIICLIFFISTFSRKINSVSIKNGLLVNYIFICLSITASLYTTNLNWFYFVGFIILLSLSNVFINSVKTYAVFSSVIIIANLLIVSFIENFESQPILYLFLLNVILFISLILIVKNNQRVSFSETILNTTKALVIVSNSKGEVIFVNNTFKEILGYTDDEVLGNGWWKVRKFVDGDDGIRERLIKGTIEKTTVVQLETKNGQRFWIQWENNRLPNGTTIAIGANITDKQEQERQFRHIVENAKDIIYTTNKEGYFTYVNDVAISATGYSREEFNEKNFKELIRPDYRNFVIQHNISEIKNNKFETYIEFPIITKNGKEIWLGQQIIFKLNSENRSFEGSQAICRDITERVSAEEKLKYYYEDLKTTNDLKQKILEARTIESLAETVLYNLIKNSRTTQFITLNFIENNKLHIFYIDKFNIKLTQTIHDLDFEIIKALHTYTSANYHQFNSFEDVKLLHLLDQPKFAKSALVNEFKDNNQLVGFIGLYTNFEYDFEKYDTHFVSDISNYIKTYFIEFEKNKIIEKKNNEIEAYTRQLEIANENLETRDKFQKIVIQSPSFEELNNTTLKTIIVNSHNARSYSFNYFEPSTDKLITYIINRNNNFVFRDEVQLNKDQKEALISLNDLISNEDDSNFDELTATLKILHQPVLNIRSIIISRINPQLNYFGFIGVYSLKAHVYTKSDLGTIKEIANALEIGLNQFENKQIIDQKNLEIEAQNKNLEILNEAQNKLINNITPDEVYDDLIKLLYSKLNNIQRATVLLFDFDKKIGELHYLDRENDELKLKDIPFDQIFVLNKFIQDGIYDVADFDLKVDLHEDEKRWHYSGIRSAYAVPIYINNRLFASINLFSNVPGNFNDIKPTINQIISSTQLIIDQLISKNIISEKNKDISANISYAKRIQDAFLPNEDALKKVFNKSFAILQQRDALGGDFYWVKEINDYSLVGVGDCTGHGVSGALLSVLATTFLNTISEKLQNNDPGIILDMLSTSIYNSFHQKNADDEIIDGLDITLCSYSKKEKLLYFAGAINTLYISRNGQIIEYKGNRKPIGFENRNLNINYDTVPIQLYSNDKIYMISDGIIDQFSSATEKRLGNKRFKEMLLEIDNYPCKERKRKLFGLLYKWQGNASQTDDICVLSFEVE